MQRLKTISSIILFLCLALSIRAQKNVTTVGIQVKPIFPLEFLGTGKETVIDQEVEFTQGLKSGFSGGMVVRHGLTNLISLESGINYIKRKYSLQINDIQNDVSIKDAFRIVSYEIPVSLLVYIQLSEKLYMNVSMGPSLDMFASSVQTFDSNYNHVSFRNHIFIPAMNANIGWEWRTEKSGYLYLGASYHRPFDYIFLSRTEYSKPGKLISDPNAFSEVRLTGSYLTVDFRYFFHEDPSTKKKKQNRKK